MSGVTPYRTIEEIAARLGTMDSYEEVNEALDKVEYLFEVIPPELQDPAEDLIARLRARLKELG
jgi:hypothetical protein